MFVYAEDGKYHSAKYNQNAGMLSLKKQKIHFWNYDWFNIVAFS